MSRHWRTGVDLVSVQEVRASVLAFGDTYLRRVYTPHELACCDGPEPARSRSLAARFAAKEAALKVLRPGDARPDWRSIEVRREPGGWTSLRWHGEAARMAARAGLGPVALSLTHQGDLAAAVVMVEAHVPHSADGDVPPPVTHDPGVTR